MGTRILQTGKLPADLLEELLESGPSLPPEVRLGPKVGEDGCAIEIPGGVLVAAMDPITLTGSDVGAHAVVINANDVAVMGVRPRWFLAAVLLPVGTTEPEVRELFRGVQRALEAVGASLVGGHTEVTPAVRQPVVVGQMMGLAENGSFVPTGGARPGDVVLQIGPAPIEGTAVLAAEAADRFGLSDELRARASSVLEDPGISVVEPALLATRLGAHAMHDPTEGGLATGLLELANASGLALRVATREVLWLEVGLEICKRAAADPWGALASGTLLAAFPPDRADAARAELEAQGFPARAIARAERGTDVVDLDGDPLAVFTRDEVARVLDPSP